MVTIARPYMQNKLKELWMLGFGDSREYVDFVFEKHLSLSNILVYLNEKKIPVAMLCMEPMRLQGRRGDWDGNYLYAFTTHPDWRGKGIGAILLQGYDKYLKAKGFHASVLTPAESSLFSYYGKYGYQTQFGMQNKEVTRAEALGWNGSNTVLISRRFSTLFDLRKEYQQSWNPLSVLWNESYLNFVGEELVLRGGEVLSVTAEGQAGYLTYRVEGDTVQITELGIDARYFEMTLSALAARVPAERYQLRLPAGYFGERENFQREILPFAMIKWYDRSKVSFTEGTIPFITHVMD